MSRNVSNFGHAKVFRVAINKLSHVIASPTRFAFFSALSLLLFWLIATKSLPYALALNDPDLALRLNASNPAALIAKAERLRVQFLNLNQGSKTGSRLPEASEDTIGKLPPAPQAGAPESVDRRGLREEIRSLALRTLENDPLNATAYRLLGEIADTPDRARILMREAVRRSQREAIAQFWLLNDSFLRSDFKSALGHAEILLQTRPDLTLYVFSYLTLLADEPEGRRFLAARLARNPSWRQGFFDALPKNVRKMDTPLQLMVALKGTAKPLTNREIAPYLDVLIEKNLVDVAYNAWLQFLPQAEQDTIGLITHPSFEREPSGVAFDWMITPGTNASVEFAPLSPDAGHALHFNMGEGRIQFPVVRQFVLFSAGSYRIDGKLRGHITGKRGLRWQIRCAHGNQRILGETEQLLGRSEQWRNFAFSFDVPRTDECKGQMLRLYHDARSPSEEFVSGEVSFADLRLTRLDATERLSAETFPESDSSEPTGDTSTLRWTSTVAAPK